MYIGIAIDEPKRFHNLTESKRSPLVEYGWTEKMCREWCEENGLLSPTYETSLRGGCWFCHNQSTAQLRLLRKVYDDTSLPYTEDVKFSIPDGFNPCHKDGFYEGGGHASSDEGEAEPQEPQAIEELF